MDKHILRLINKKIALVGSVADDKPFIKAMLVNNKEGNNIFYFASNNGSRRVAQWKVNPNACLYFYGGPIYRGVMLEGTMEIINDPIIKQAQWQKGMEHVYQNGGINDPDYCVLKFIASKGRYYHWFKSTDFSL